MEKFIGVVGIPIALWMLGFMYSEGVYWLLFVVPIAMLAGSISMLIGDEKESNHVLKKIKNGSDYVGISIVAIVGVLIVAGLFGLFDSCEDKYRKAWEECNEKYNGKCTYLGPKFKPNCTLDNTYYDD